MSDETEAKQHTEAHTDEPAEAQQETKKKRARRAQDFEKVGVRWTVRRAYSHPKSPFLFVPIWDDRSKKLTRISTGETNARRARVYAKKWIAEQEAREQQKPSPAAVIFEVAFEEYLAWLKGRGRREATLHGYKSDLEVYKRSFEGRPVREIIRADINAFLTKLKTDGRSVRTQHKHIAALKAFFSWAMDKNQEYVEANPCDRVAKEIATEERYEPTALTVDQARLLIRKASEDRVLKIEDARRSEFKQDFPRPKHLGLALLIAFSTGLRRKNVLQLRWAQVDTKERLISIDAKEMKGRRSHKAPMTRELVAVLKEVKRAKEEDLGHVPGPEDRVLGVEIKELTSSFKSLLKSLKADGVPETVRFHDTRVSFASWLADGCSFAVLRDLMGHSMGSTGVTGGYVETKLPERFAAVDKLPRLLAAPGKKARAQKAAEA